MLHSIDNIADSCSLSFDNFVSFMKMFEAEIKSRKIVITFDDGYESVYTRCFPIFKEKQISFMCFVVPDFLNKKGYLSEPQLSEMLATGLLEIGSHGQTHKILNSLSAEEIKNEVCESKCFLEKTFGSPVSSFAYSHGIFNKTTIDLLKKVGYEFAFIASANLRDFLIINRYKIPRYNLKDDTFVDVVKEIGFYEKKSI